MSSIWPQKNIQNLTFLLIHCLMYFKIFVGVLCFFFLFFLFYYASLCVLSIFVNTMTRCFALTVFLMSCDCKCSVALPHDAVG